MLAQKDADDEMDVDEKPKKAAKKAKMFETQKLVKKLKGLR